MVLSQWDLITVEQMRSEAETIVAIEKMSLPDIYSPMAAKSRKFEYRKFKRLAEVNAYSCGLRRHITRYAGPTEIRTKTIWDKQSLPELHSIPIKTSH